MIHKLVHRGRVTLAFIFANLFLIIITGVILSANAQQQNTSPCYHKELDGLDFLVGDWVIDANARLADGRWEQGPASSQIKRELSQCLLDERFNGSRTGRPFSALGIMGFNSVSGKLQKVWSDSEHGVLILYEGVRNGKEIILDTEILLNGNKVKLRNSYLEIANDSFRLESSRSHDDGKTWITVSKLAYKRKAR
jgi:hypothetical protein